MNKTRPAHFGEKGFTLVEVVIAMVILSVVALGSMKAFWFISQQNVVVNNRSFAAQKAVQMIEELRGLIADADTEIGVLDNYDNGSGYKYTMSTRSEVNANLSVVDPGDLPGDPISGNSGLKFKRQIRVLQMPNEELARRVYVRVYDAESNEVLAETVSVLRSVRNQFYPTQEYDIYVLSLENVPGWWSALSTLQPIFDSMVEDLKVRNPGLNLRVHYVTRMAYGRDPFYMPYTNDATRADNVASPWVYFYPGNVDKPSVGDFLYYVPDAFQGRINIDGAAVNPNSYSIADQYNQAVRYPDEESLYAAAVASAAATGTTAPEISLRMLWERMNTSSDTYRNLLLVNLHGELLPLPPMRNYSDAAKAPMVSTYTNVRAVTHPERLQYASGSQVNLRVYTYVMDPTNVAWTSTSSTTLNILISTPLTSANVSVRKAYGSASADYSWGLTTAATDYILTNPTASQTLITIFNSPLRHGESTNGSGLDSGDRLHGLEYIPCPLAGTGASFTEGTRDLVDAGTDNLPHNTARWVIQIAAGALSDGMHTIETRLGDDYTTGIATNQPTNISRTYTWVGATAPATEKYQFMGDPRHMPYADIKAALGYNWYFNVSVVAADYPGYTNVQDRWNGSVNVDIPRYMQALRTGLMNSEGIWTSMTGFSNYYVGLGGEIGYDSSNLFSDSIEIVGTPWNNAGTIGVQEITSGAGSSSENYSRIISSDNNNWWGLYWLGELYPDSAYNLWSSSGNLPVGANQYYRRRFNGVTGFTASEVQKRTADKGSSSFFNGNPSGNDSSWFNHQYRDGNGATLTVIGSTVAADFNFPLLNSMTASRPFLLNMTDTSRRPDEWNLAPYNVTSGASRARTTLTTFETWYETDGYNATEDSSALLRFHLGAGTRVGNVVMNGLSPTGSFGNSQIAKLCLTNQLRAFMTLGSPAATQGAIAQLPLVAITSPTVSAELPLNVSDINVTWSTTWTRWDGAAYTSAYAGYASPPGMGYNLKYSVDNGQTWRFVNTGLTAEEGVYSAANAVTSPVTWNVSAFGAGTYIIRVEGYRNGLPLHYSHHQRRVYIRR